MTWIIVFFNIITAPIRLFFRKAGAYPLWELTLLKLIRSRKSRSAPFVVDFLRYDPVGKKHIYTTDTSSQSPTISYQCQRRSCSYYLPFADRSDGRSHHGGRHVVIRENSKHSTAQDGTTKAAAPKTVFRSSIGQTSERCSHKPITSRITLTLLKLDKTCNYALKTPIFVVMK